MGAGITRSVMPPSLIVASSSAIYFRGNGADAFDPSDGVLLRNYPIQSTNGISIYGELLLASWHLHDGRVAAFRLESGVEIWQAPTHGRPAEAPVVAGGLVFVSTSEGTVFAFDALTGAPVWTQTIGPIMFTGPVVENGYLFLAPAVNTPDAPLLHALDARSGQMVWTANLAESTTQKLTVQSGVIYLCAHRSCAAIRASDGVQLWRYPLDGAPTSGAIISGDTLYLTEQELRVEWPTDDAGEPKHIEVPAVTALDSTTGSLRWRRVLSDGVSGPGCLTTPACDASHIFFGDDGVLYTLDTDGAELWRYKTKGDRLSTPLISDDKATVYVGSNDGNVYALDVATGALRWRAFTDIARSVAIGISIVSMSINRTENTEE